MRDKHEVDTIKAATEIVMAAVRLEVPVSVSYTPEGIITILLSDKGFYERR